MTTYLENTTWKCGWCGALAAMNPHDYGYCPDARNFSERSLSTITGLTTYWVMRCSACEADSVAVVAAPGTNLEVTGRARNARSVFRSSPVLDWHPHWVEGTESLGAPAHIQAAADEAFKCASIGAHMAAILMARTALEAAAKDKDITSGNLVAKIKALAEAGHIRPRVADAADGIRRFGNDMAHGDIQVEVTPQDAEQVLALLRIVLADIYQTDAVLEAVGVSLDKRKAGPPTL